jgi:Gpi16 subunit, GPI transamidase component
VHHALARAPACHFRKLSLTLHWVEQIERPVEDARSAPPPPATLQASQQLLGSGDESAVWQLLLRRPAGDGGGGAAARHTVLACTSTALPWYLQPWVHTLSFRLDGAEVARSQVRCARCAQCRPCSARPCALCSLAVVPAASVS